MILPMTPDTTEPLYTRDIDPGPIISRKLALVGYGNHGRSHALCLRDSGVSQIRIALRPGSASRAKAEADGFEVVTVAEAAAWADAIALLAADEAHRQIWTQDILPHRKRGQALIVCHGFSVHYGMIEAPADADIILAAAKGPGGAVREEFLKGRGLIGFWAVHQDASGQARALQSGRAMSGFSRPHSARKPCPTCSANRSCWWAAWWRWPRRVSRG